MKLLLLGIGAGLGVAASRNLPPTTRPAGQVVLIVWLLSIVVAGLVAVNWKRDRLTLQVTQTLTAEFEARLTASQQQLVQVNIAQEKAPGAARQGERPGAFSGGLVVGDACELGEVLQSGHALVQGRPPLDSVGVQPALGVDQVSAELVAVPTQNAVAVAKKADGQDTSLANL